MFGFSKKQSLKQEEKGKQKNQPIAALNIPDDKFTVMPQQYLSQKGKSVKIPDAPSTSSSSSAESSINEKFLILGGAALAALAGLSIVLYVIFFSPDSIDAPVAQAPAPQANQPAAQQEPEKPEISQKIISTQAYDGANVLIGSMEITVPATVVQEYGAGIGITALESDDLTLPEEGTLVGGLYSAYPAGVSFDDPLSIEIAVSDIPEGAQPADIYPVYLRGVKWQEFDDYQATETGFIIILEKLPTGTIAVIWNPAQPEENPEINLNFRQAVPSVDTDEDGLTDAEEQMIGTSISSPDSDEDTYTDLEEIKNGYSPLASDGALLEGSGIFAQYTNPTYGYKISYPSGWLADSLDTTNKQVLFISETEEFFEVLIQENPLNTPIVDWFRSMSASLKNIELDVSVLAGRPAVWSPDGLTLYTSRDGLIYIITYNRGTRDEVSWPNMFEYFYNSFAFGNTVNDNKAQESGDDLGSATADILQ